MGRSRNNHIFISGLILVGGPFIILFCWYIWGEGASENLNLMYPLWDIAISAIIGLGILVSIIIWPVPKSHKKHLAILWMIRMVLALGLMLFYESFFTSIDAIGYYRRGIGQEFNWAEIRFGLGTEIITAFSILVDKVIPKSYHTMKLISSLVGFGAIYLFYRAACIYWKREDIRLLYFLALFPSILFWSSILGKDSFTLLGIAIYAYGVVGYFIKKRISYIFFIVLGIVLASAIRIWLGFIFVIPLGVFVLMGKYSRMKKIIFLIVTAFIFILSYQFFSNQFGISSLDDLVQRANFVAQAWDSGGSAQEIQDFSSITDMILFAPKGAFTALFRPLPGEVMNPFGLLAGAENLFVLLLIARFLVKGSWNRLGDPIMIWLFFTIIVWAGIYGFVSYQNLGTAFRFKLQIMPMLLLLLLNLNRPKERFKSFLKQ